VAAQDVILRFFLYGLLGWCAEIVWTAVLGFAASRDWRLAGVSYLWMFPIYGSIAFLYEPLHDALRGWPIAARAVVWALGFTAVEFASGFAIARATGRCPWDYQAAGARFAINPYIRWDYVPLWAAVGLALEPLHDFLVRLTPAIHAAWRGPGA
jgi:uncharacterized membrane protein